MSEQESNRARARKTLQGKGGKTGHRHKLAVQEKNLFGDNKMDREDWVGYQVTSFSFAYTQEDGSSRANNYRKRERR
jgi:hypothetical protein